MQWKGGCRRNDPFTGLMDGQHVRLSCTWISNGAEQRVLGLAGIEACVLCHDGYVGADHAGEVDAPRNDLGIAKIIEANVSGATCRHSHTIRTCWFPASCATVFTKACRRSLAGFSTQLPSLIFSACRKSSQDTSATVSMPFRQCTRRQIGPKPGHRRP